MLTVLEIIKKTTEFFATKGVESPRLDAELLVAHGLKLQRMQLYLQFERVLSAAELDAIRPLVKRRGLREPLQHILGTTDFFDLKLKTDRRALVPRPETEELVDRLVRMLLPPPARVLDLGTGSGAIALGLARAWPQAAVTAIDKSPAALALARDNAAAAALTVRVEFLESDWFTALAPTRRFELIVANPPYLTAEEVAAASPEVREFDPPSALVAGDDGCTDLEHIIRRRRQRFSRRAAGSPWKPASRNTRGCWRSLKSAATSSRNPGATSASVTVSWCCRSNARTKRVAPTRGGVLQPPSKVIRYATQPGLKHPATGNPR